MEKSSNKFKMIVMGVFGFFIIAGLLAFSMFRSTNTANSQVNVSIWGTVSKTVFDNFVSKYEQDKNLQFKLTYTEKDISTIDSDLVEAIATGKGPDAILIPQEFMSRYLDKITFITSVTQRTFLDTYIQEAGIYIQQSGIFAIPFFVDPLVMYWNKDMFASAAVAAPPATWSEFPLLAGKFTTIDQNGNITRSAASFGEYANIDNAKALISTLIMQAGSPIASYDDSTGSFISSLYQKSADNSLIPAVSALTFFTDYSNPKKSVYSWNSSLPSSKNFFISGNLATYFGFASEAADIANKNPNLNFDVAMMPQTLNATAKTTFGELYGFAFLKSSPNTVAAFNLISMLTNADGVSEFLQLNEGAPARKDLIAAGTPDPQKAVFYDSALIAKGWVDPSIDGTNAIFKSMVSDITTGSLSVDDSVQKADTKLNILFQQ